MKKKKVFIIAGEVSGDVLGGEIMRASGDQFDFAGIGGAEMKSAGLKSLFPISDLSVMGFVEVLKKSKTLLSRIRQTADAIAKRRPDVVLTIDSSSFATRVIRRVRRRGGQLPKFYHVVAPMVWAWGAWRAKKYARVFDKMFCFFDFEVPYFTKYGLDATAIGYPIYDVARRALKKSKKKYIALLPGSRMGEVSKMMPVFKELASRCGAARFAIPTTETTRDFISHEIKSWLRPPKLVPFADRYKLYNETEIAVATSGTATAELAIMHVPAVVVYRANWMTLMLANIVLKTKYISLVNILENREIYPELRGCQASADNIIAGIEKIKSRDVAGELAAADKLWHKNQQPMKIVINAIRDS